MTFLLNNNKNKQKSSLNESLDKKSDEDNDYDMVNSPKKSNINNTKLKSVCIKENKKSEKNKIIKQLDANHRFASPEPSLNNKKLRLRTKNSNPENNLENQRWNLKFPQEKQQRR